MVSIQLRNSETFTLPRTFITNYLPQSIIAEALELDPNATVIPILNPTITPAVMSVLVDLSQGREPDYAVPELAAADRYLNIPGLQYYSDPGYNYILNRANINDPTNRTGIDRIIDEDRGWAYAYLLAKGYRPTHKDLMRATKVNPTGQVRQVIKQTRIIPQPYVASMLMLMDPLIEEYQADYNDAVRRKDFNHVRTRRADLSDMKAIAAYLAKEDWENALQAVEELDTAVRDSIPDPIWGALNILNKNPEEEVRDFGGYWADAQKLTWDPPLPKDPVDIFGPWEPV